MPKTFLSSYFGFNKQQRNGIYVLLSLSIILLLIRLLFPYFIHPDEIQILNLPLAERKLDSLSSRASKGINTSNKLFLFDPNKVSLEELKQLGFSEKTAKNLIKFREKGFVFHEKKDLLKVYGVHPEHFAKIENYITLPNPDKKTTSTKTFSPLESQQKKSNQIPDKKVELNSADSSELIALKGIGASYAKRILKYRSILGGYSSVEQLKEVYGMKDETYNSIKDLFTININLIQKLNLNTDDFKKINKHPYISYDLCKTIFDWRRKTKISATNLKTILNDEALYLKLLPYLTFE